MTRSRGDGRLRWLLGLYPRSFRARFGREMLDSWRRDRERPVFRGSWGRVRFWWHAWGDLVRTAPAAWIGVVSRRRRGPSRPVGPAAILHDLKFVQRGLRREPGFTLIATLTMGLGIGAATAVFTVVYGVLLAPLPFEEPGRLVRVWELERENPGARMVAYGNYADLRERGEGELFDDLAIWAYSAHTLTGTGQALRLRTRAVSSNFARVFRVAPTVGRWLSPDEERLGDNVVVLSHHLWRDNFATDSSIVGQTVRLEDEPYTVIGVMPPRFVFPPTADAWVPLDPVTSPTGLRRWHRHAMVGRIATGVALGDVQAGLRALSDDLAVRYPETNTANYFEAQTLRDALVGGVKPALRILFGGCALLLLIACVNIASLLLAKSSARSRELAVRSALGASRGRLVGFLALESLVLGAIGGAVGLIIATLSTTLLPRFAAGTIPRLEQVHVGLPVYLFAVAASLASALVVSVGPALRGSRRDEGPAAALRTGRGGATPATVRNRRLLVGTELAVAVVLVTTAGLLIRSFGRLTAVDTGVRPEGVLTMDVRVPLRGSRDSLAIARRINEMVRTFERVPAVQRVAAVLTEPVDASGWFNALTIRDRPVPEAERPAIAYNVVTPGYFDVVGASMVAGRAFDASDLEQPDRVVILNRAAAERYFPDRDPLGALILGDAEQDIGWARVVGIVEDLRQSLWEPAWPEVFVPLEQEPLSSIVVVARVMGDPTRVASALTQAARQWEPDMPVTNVVPLAERIGTTINQPRFNALLMGMFALIALILACVGVYGVLSYMVAERRREFGIRMAVGASRHRVLVNVLKEAGLLGTVAVLLGSVVAVGAARLLEGLLFDVGPVDPVVLAGVAGLVLCVSVVAGVVPARAATVVDPAGVLREE